MYSPSSNSSFFFGLGGIGVTAKPLLLVESLGREFPKEPRNLFPLAVLLSPLPHITNGYPPLKLTPPKAAPAEAGDIPNACNCKPPPVAPTKTTEDANPAAARTYAISAARFSNKLPDKLLCAKSLKGLGATNLDPMAKKKIRSSQQQSAAVKETGENLLIVGFHFEASESMRRTTLS